MRHRLILRLALLAGAAATAAPALAEEEEGAEERDYLSGGILVVGERDDYLSEDGSTAVKTPTPLIDVPQAVTVITRDQLDDQNVRQLGDALRYVPGVSLETGEGHRDEVFIRGQETTADFYIDGLRDDAQYYRPLYNIERVEVLKGANALIFGRGAGGGAINRVSKVADPDRMTFGSLSASVDTFGGFAIAGDVNVPFSMDAAGRLNATYEEFDNHRDVFEGRFFGVSPTFTADIGETTRLTATYSYDDDERVTDRGLPSLEGRPLVGFDETFFGDPDFNFSDTAVHIARTRVDHAFSDALSANATVQYADYDKYYGNIVPDGATATTVRLSGYESSTWRENLIGQANLVAQFETGGVGHTLLIGVEGARQDTATTRDRALFDNGAGGTATSVTVPLAETIAVPGFTLQPQRASESELSTFSFYAQEQLELGPVQLVAGIRHDSFDLDTFDLVGGFAGSRKDSRWSPRFGAILKPQENLSLYASYTESFLPQSGDQFLLLSPTSVALEPETFENIEAGVKYAVRPDLLLTAAIFRLDRSNTQAPDPANSGFVVLAGESRVEGVELNLAGALTPNLNVNLGYTYLDGEIRSDTTSAEAGTRLEQVPRHQIGAWARYDVTDRFGFGAGVVHQSKQFASLSNAVVLPSYTRVDAALYFDVSERVGLQLNVENIFDEKYFPSAHGDNNIQPAKPLNATLAARMKF